MMKILIILFLFCLFENVSAKTITTPYIKFKEVDKSYQVKDLEKIEKITYYEQKKIDKDFKYLEKPNKEYPFISDDIIYSDYTNYSSERLNDKSLDEDIKIVYSYKELKKIDSLSINNIKDLLITRVVLKDKDKILYEGKSKTIKLSKKYSPEYLTLEVTCFLNQEDVIGSFTISNSNYIKDEIMVKNKGYNTIEIKLINHLTKTLYEDKILKNSNIDNNFYIKIIDKEILYRYRKKYYKCYKEDVITDTYIHDGYEVVKTFDKYYLYRKEIIDIFDDIELSNYLDLSKVIKMSTIPLSKLEFSYTKTCSKSDLIIKYQDFKEVVPITFNCEVYNKSTVSKGKTKSFFREIFGILFKTLFLKKL